MPSLEERVQRLEDIEAITQVLLNYGRHLDARDFKSYAGLFAAQGVWDGGFGAATTPDGIYDLMIGYFGTEPNPKTLSNYHLLSNFMIDVEGDKATSWSRWAYVTPGSGGTPIINIGGRYADELVREGGDWKISRRTVSADLRTEPLPEKG